MNYYDEEIVIAGPDTKNLSTVKINKIGERKGPGIESRNGEKWEKTGINSTSGRRNNQLRQRSELRKQSSDDDGLLQDIIDHSDENDDEDSDNHNPSSTNVITKRITSHRTPGSMRPTSSHFANLPSAKVIDNDSELSESGSDEKLDATIAIENINLKSNSPFGFPPSRTHIPSGSSEMLLKKQSPINDTCTPQFDITPDKWEELNLHQEIKDLFPYILKYTPQHIEVPYRLQPFIPEYVPAVGDVDAFLKVTTPPILDPKREYEMNEHIRKLGLYFLDEPAGEQSQPSLVNMKLRSVLTGSGVNPRLVSAALIPTAKSPKDIDKWITEVEQVHMSQSVHDVQSRKDIEPLLIDWPREYAMSAQSVQEAYRRSLNEEITLTDYIGILSEQFHIEGRLDTQADYILNIQTLFTLYLAATQSWE